MDGLAFLCPIKRAHKGREREREEIITVFFGFLTEHKKRESRTPKVIVREWMNRRDDRDNRRGRDRGKRETEGGQVPNKMRNILSDSEETLTEETKGR